VRRASREYEACGDRRAILVTQAAMACRAAQASKVPPERTARTARLGRRVARERTLRGQFRAKGHVGHPARLVLKASKANRAIVQDQVQRALPDSLAHQAYRVQLARMETTDKRDQSVQMERTRSTARAPIAKVVIMVVEGVARAEVVRAAARAAEATEPESREIHRNWSPQKLNKCFTCTMGTTRVVVK
jgi:hypothetical protein